MSLTLSTEKIEFLKKHRFHLIEDSPLHLDKYPYVYGPVKGQRNHMEIYNEVSVSRLITELETNGEALNSTDSVLFNTIKTELYSVNRSKIDRISMKKDRNTGEMRVSDPIEKFFNARYTRLIVNETNDYFSFIGRYTGDFGDGSQYIQHAYKTREAAIKVAIPLIEKQKNEIDEQKILLDTLLKEYTSG